MSLQQGGTMQAATQRCPPGVFRERYSLSDFDITRVYGEGPNWTICAARCRWSSELVVLQMYTEVGNVSGCMALALGAAHSLTHHPALLPLYAVFRDHVSSSADWPGLGAGHGLGPGARADRVVMVYPGASAQHPLDAGGSSSGASSAPASAPAASAVGGPPVSERGVVRSLLQPFSELVAGLSAPGLRPTYVCGLDVWMDSPEAPAPGQALFMVPLMCHRRPRNSLFELPPAAMPYAAPYVRSNPAAAVEQVDADELLGRRWLAWSAAALVHTTLMGFPPQDKSGRRRKGRTSEGHSFPAAASSPTGGASPGAVTLLPPLSSGGSGTNSPRKNVLAALGVQRPGPSPLPSNTSSTMPMMMQPSHSSLSSNGGSASGPHSRVASSVNGATLNGVPPAAAASAGSAPSLMMTGGTLRGGLGQGDGHGHGHGHQGHGRSNNGPLGPMPLWLSDEAGDWFRRGLAADCAARAPLDELMRHPWVCRHAVPRSLSSAGGHVGKRESFSSLPRELHPLLLDLVPLGVSRPGREEVDTMMAEMAATEGPSTAKPAMPWQVLEGPQEQASQAPPAPPAPAGPALAPPTPAAADGSERAETPLVAVRYEMAEEQQDDGTRVVEELRVMSSKPEHLNRAAKALQAAMVKRGDAGQWVMANPRGTTFEEIAKQNQTGKGQVPFTLPVAGLRQRRSSVSGPPGMPLTVPPSPSSALPSATLESTSPPGLPPPSRLVGSSNGAASGPGSLSVSVSASGQVPALPFPGGGGGARGRSPARNPGRGLASLPAKPVQKTK